MTLVPAVTAEKGGTPGALLDTLAPRLKMSPASSVGSLCREDLAAPSKRGNVLHWGNWRNRVWNPAEIETGFFREVRKGKDTVKRATVAPCDLRHSFCSLLMREGPNPQLVAAAIGPSAQLIWKTYGHIFEATRLAPAVSMVDAIRAARERARSRELCERITGSTVWTA